MNKDRVFVSAILFFAGLLLFVRPVQAANGEPQLRLASQTKALTIEMSFSTNFTVKSYPLNFDNNPRYVVDVYDAKLSESTFKPGDEYNFQVNSKTVDSVRIAQYQRNPDVVRIVMDLARADVDFIVEHDPAARRLVVREGSAPKIKNPRIWSGRTGTAVTFDFKPMSGNASFSAQGKSLFVTFPGYQPENPGAVVSVHDGLVETIVWHKNGAGAVAELNLLSAPDYTQEFREGAGQLVVTVRKSADAVQPSVPTYNPLPTYEPPAAYQPPAGSVKRTFSNTHICIDPGHGGNDPGAIGADGTEEADIVLDVANRLKTTLANSGARITTTRNTDVFISLKGRVDVANSVGCDVFVSIHANALADHGSKLDKRGIQTYYYGELSEPLARVMLENMNSMLGIGDLGMYDRSLYVTRNTEMRAVLVELAYMTHPHDLALLKTLEFRENAARSLYNGIVEYLGLNATKMAALKLPYQVASMVPARPYSRYLAKQKPAVVAAYAPPPVQTGMPELERAFVPASTPPEPYSPPAVNLYDDDMPGVEAASPVKATDKATATAQKTQPHKVSEPSVEYKRIPPEFAKEPWNK